jgi:hypothetical protein
MLVPIAVVQHEGPSTRSEGRLPTLSRRMRLTASEQPKFERNQLFFTAKNAVTPTTSNSIN